MCRHKHDLRRGGLVSRSRDAPHSSQYWPLRSADVVTIGAGVPQPTYVV